MAVERSITLMGGVKRRGRWVVPEELLSISGIGGVNVDCSLAEIPADGVTITKISLVGGVNIVVPRGANVDIDGFTLIGGRSDERTGGAAAGGPTIRIRAYGIFGGITIRDA